jgi:hypothetical protein
MGFAPTPGDQTLGGKGFDAGALRVGRKMFARALQ